MECFRCGGKFELIDTVPKLEINGTKIEVIFHYLLYSCPTCGNKKWSFEKVEQSK